MSRGMQGFLAHRLDLVRRLSELLAENFRGDVINLKLDKKKKNESNGWDSKESFLLLCSDFPFFSLYYSLPFSRTSFSLIEIQ